MTWFQSGIFLILIVRADRVESVDASAFLVFAQLRFDTLRNHNIGLHSIAAFLKS